MLPLVTTRAIDLNVLLTKERLKMRIETLAVGFKLARVGLFVLMGVAQTAQAAGGFRLERNAEGLVRPFKAVAVPLMDVIQEYSRFTQTPVTFRRNEIRGTATLFLRKPLKPEELTEIFHRVLNDNDFAVVDAPAGNGWIIQRTRDARDGPLGVYEAADVPNTARLVTAIHALQYAQPDAVARLMRSFMPANSRIIPATGSRVFITDTGSNIRKLMAVISTMDTEEVAKRERQESSGSRAPRNCGEHRIEKLVVEKLEIQDNGSVPAFKVNPKLGLSFGGSK
jgi:type II secretory pathway component GspD/PulD (secretin)